MSPPHLTPQVNCLWCWYFLTINHNYCLWSKKYIHNYCLWELYVLDNKSLYNPIITCLSSLVSTLNSFMWMILTYVLCTKVNLFFQVFEIFEILFNFFFLACYIYIYFFNFKMGATICTTLISSHILKWSEV